MKCGIGHISCMAWAGGQCFEFLVTATPSCPHRVPITNADVILSNVKDLDCLTELIWRDSWHEVFDMPEFDSKQELADWLRQPKEEKP